MSIQSFKIAISKEDFNEIKANSKEELYGTASNDLKLRNLKCTGKWVDCMVEKINEIEKSYYKMLGKYH